jgi:hypothetical protein
MDWCKQLNKIRMIGWIYYWPNNYERERWAFEERDQTMTTKMEWRITVNDQCDISYEWN